MRLLLQAQTSGRLSCKANMVQIPDNIFLPSSVFAFAVFRLSIFCLILFFRSMNDFLYSIISEAKAAIFLQIISSTYLRTILFALFKFHQASNAKVISCKKGGRFRGRLKDFSAFLSLLQKLWSQDLCIRARINKASLPIHSGLGL